jgi:hypothetical protein
VRVVLLSIPLALYATIVLVSAQAIAQHSQFHIPGESIDRALTESARQTWLQIARFSDTIDGRAIVGRITGEFSVEQALSSLVTPRGLSYKIVNDQNVAVLQLETRPIQHLRAS